MSVSSRSARVAIAAFTLGVLAIGGIGRALAADAETQPASQAALPIKVEVKLSTSKLQPGAACIANVIVTNTSSGVVIVRGGKAGPDVEPVCRRGRDRVVLASGQYEPDGGQLSLKPGEAATVTLNLTGMYKLQTPGPYLFSATVQFSLEELGPAKEQDRIWVPSFRANASFSVSED